MTDKEIARLSAPVLQAYRDMEDELLRMIARQIGKDRRVSDTSKWMISHLARAGEVNRQALMIIDSYAGGVDAECAEAILAAAEGEVGTLDEAMLSLLSEPGEMTEDVQQALDAFSRQGRQELAVQDARIAEPYAQALTERCNMVNTVMGYSAVSAYNNAVREIARNAGEIDRSAVLREMNAGAASVVMGTESIQQATRQTIHRMAEKGLPGFVDKAGRQWSPEAYVRMDLRTTMGNTARAAQDARCDEWGIQLIEVSSHNGARPKCAPYQGRIFSRDGSRGVTRDLDGNQIEYIPLSETSYGEPDGLFGINCGHQQYPFIPGVSMRSYYPYPEEENAERYQQMQQQRAMERRIRADKRECMMLQETGDEEGLKKAAGKLRADRDRYKDFRKETGLGARNENTQVYGYDRSKSMKTVWANRTNGSGTVGNAANSTAVSAMAAPAGTTANYVPYSLTGSVNGGIIGNTEMFRRRVAENGREIIDKPTYNKLTKKFRKNGGIIIRGEEASRHLAEQRGHAAYLPSLNAAFIQDDATISEVLEEMYHAEQDRRNMFGTELNDEVILRREIDAQKHLLSLSEKYKIPQSEIDETQANLEYYERKLEMLLSS